MMHRWEALGSVGLIAWGVREQRVERSNLGMLGFAASVLAFYFSSVMDKLGRSASLIGFGVLFLADRAVTRREVQLGSGTASPGEGLWVELTVPPRGAPRPLRLAVERNGALTPVELR
jgi:hypothetical protein